MASAASPAVRLSVVQSRTFMWWTWWRRWTCCGCYSSGLPITGLHSLARLPDANFILPAPPGRPSPVSYEP
ncbi:hypothetical protein DFH06DRAFT_1336593 [Mycena polygramma]|nr:hypothetical protein DFH06DRAFT_1336593 [Mycena polygramma]